MSREIEILKLITRGFSDAQIAEKLAIPMENIEQAVLFHRKFGTQTRAQAIVVAMRKGLLAN